MNKCCEFPICSGLYMRIENSQYVETQKLLNKKGGIHWMPPLARQLKGVILR